MTAHNVSGCCLCVCLPVGLSPAALRNLAAGPALAGMGQR